MVPIQARRCTSYGHRCLHGVTSSSACMDSCRRAGYGCRPTASSPVPRQGWPCGDCSLCMHVCLQAMCIDITPAEAALRVRLVYPWST